jgi:hypothetical protein
MLHQEGTFLEYIVYVAGVRLSIRTAATNSNIVHPPGDNEYGEPRWNDTDRKKPKNS